MARVEGGRMADLPSGTVTFLFTDVEGSSRLWEAYPDAMQGASARHDEIVRGAIEAHNGSVVKTTGDGFHAAFTTASDAVAAAVDTQLGLAAESWSNTDPIRARIGIHTGAAEIRDGDYYGPALNRAARVMDAGHGGQVLVSGATGELVRGSGVELVDLGSHQLRDLGERERIFQVLHPNLTSEFPALRTYDAFATNLPLQVTTFVGRDDDVADVIDALEQSRVLTLIGVGGVGKTRLAVQTAAKILPRYRDGVWLCELGPLNDAGQVPDVVATALGVQQRPDQSITDSLLLSLRSRELLLILDNCEHLLDAAAQLVAAIVESCPAVTVLATGREGLGVRGERMMMVRSLALPAPNATSEEILAAGAVRLFAERADQVGIGVDLDDETVSTLSQLCRRLDGIPLAIELAAARTRMMSPQEIAGRLDERFRLLTGGSRTTVERHQTLQRAVEWSYDLLDERERTVLDRLGVFAGGFTLQAAEAVVSDDDMDALDVLDIISQLVDKSLVEPEREQHDTRYRLLETIRSYALVRLDERGATDAIRRRHATWCTRFMADVSEGVRGPDEGAWLARVDREVDNIRAALTWAIDVDDTELAVSLMGDFRYWALSATRLGYWLAPWADAVLGTTGAVEHPRAAYLLTVRAHDHLNQRRNDEGERDGRRALELLAQPSVPFSPGPWSVWCMGLIYQSRAREVVGADDFIDAARASADDDALANALVFVALWWYILDSPERCIPFAEEAMHVAERLENPSLMAASGLFFGAALCDSDPIRARAVLETAVDHAIVPTLEGPILANLGRLGADPTDPRWATRFRRGLALSYGAGDTPIVTMHIDLYSQLLASTGRVEAAAVLSSAAARLGSHGSNPISVAHRHATEEQLAAQLDHARMTELSERGAALDYEGMVALAFAELDRVIESAESQVSNA
jgi:predicted ATPase/class 3 adenylate cyclase